MDRRSLLKFMLASPLASVVDYEKLLWIPGEKTIFIPTTIRCANITEIIDLEMKRVIPYVARLYERDDTFYRAISKRELEPISNREIRVPFTIKPGSIKI